MKYEEYEKDGNAYSTWTADLRSWKWEQFKKVALMSDEELEALIDHAHAVCPKLTRKDFSCSYYAIREVVLDMLSKNGTRTVSPSSSTLLKITINQS
jgi:hypothetical protein